MNRNYTRVNLRKIEAKGSFINFRKSLGNSFKTKNKTNIKQTNRPRKTYNFANQVILKPLKKTFFLSDKTFQKVFDVSMIIFLNSNQIVRHFTFSFQKIMSLLKYRKKPFIKNNNSSLILCSRYLAQIMPDLFDKNL